MAEETPKKPKTGGGKGKGKGKSKGGWQKALALIPLDQLATPKGMVGVALIGAFELAQALLVPSGADLLIETIIHLLLIYLLAKLFDKDPKQEIKNQIAPLVVGLIPAVSDYIPEVILMNVILPFLL